MTKHTKFSPITLQVKKALKEVRLKHDLSMNEAAKMLSISRKKLEDIEATRDYGCYIDLETIIAVCVVYGIEFDDLIRNWPISADSALLRKPVKRGAAAH